MTATRWLPSLAAITGLRQLVLSGSLSLQGRLSQWAQSKMRVSAFRVVITGDDIGILQDGTIIAL